MPERSSLTQGVQVGVETTPGTAVAANKQFQSIGITPGVSVDMQKFRPMGTKYSTIITPGKEFVEAKIDGAGSYTELTYLFASCLVSTTPSVVDTTGQSWAFQPAVTTEDTVKTLSVEQGGVVRAHKFSYGLVTELELDMSRDGCDVSGSMIGQRLSDGITLTASPTAVTQVPILPTDIDVFIDPTSGALGTTKMTRVLHCNIKLSGRFGPIWTLNSALASYAAHVETEPTAQLVLMMEADTQGMANLPIMRGGTTQFARVKGTSPTLAGSVSAFYSLTWDVAVKVSDVGDFSDEDGVYAIEWTFDFVYDATWGKSFITTLVNKLSTL